MGSHRFVQLICKIPVYFFLCLFISTDLGAQEKIEASELWDVPYSGFSEVKSDTTSDIGPSGSLYFIKELTNFQFEYGLQLPPDIMNNDYRNTTYHAAQNILKSNKLSPEERIFHTEIFLRSRNNEMTLNFISQVAQDQLISWATEKAIDKLGVSDSMNIVADPLGTVESKVIHFVSPMAGTALNIIAKSIEVRDFFNNREQYRSFYTEVMELMDESRGLNRKQRDDYVADLEQKIQNMKHDLYDVANQAHTQIKDIAKKVGMPPEFQNESILYALGYGANEETGPGQRANNRKNQEEFERYLRNHLTPEQQMYWRIHTGKIVQQLRSSSNAYTRRMAQFELLIKEIDLRNKALDLERKTQRETDLGKDELGRIVHGIGSSVTTANPEKRPNVACAGEVVFSHSGSWKEAYGGWRDEENPPNAPYNVGPTFVGPGRYRVTLTYAPDIQASYTAGNYNTGMRIIYIHEGGARQVANLRPRAGDKARGEAVKTFTLSNAGQLKVRYTMAASRGQAGGYYEHEQTFSSTIELVEHLPEQKATSGTDLMPGDTLRTGKQSALARFIDGTKMQVLQDSEVQLTKPSANTIHVDVKKGGARFQCSPKNEYGLQVGIVGEKIQIVPTGTEFIVRTEGVDVIHGMVNIFDASESITLRAGKRFVFSENEIAELDQEDMEMPTSSDGIPLEDDYWAPNPVKFGSQSSSFCNNTVVDDWLLADPPLRWKRPGLSHLPRVKVSTPQAGTLSLDVPGGSRLDDRGNTAPRLLHKITDDFVLEAEITVEAHEASDALLRFLVRAPGSYAGAQYGQFPRTQEDGPGQDYWLCDKILSTAAQGKIRLQALRENSNRKWPEVEDGPVRIRLMRTQDVWISSWSLDNGRTWQTSSLHRVGLPETVWIGWAFINIGPAKSKVRFTLRDVKLTTMPTGTLEIPKWLAFAPEGKAVLQDDSLQLRLNQGQAASLRMYSSEYYVDNFDVQVSFEGVPDDIDSGGRLRWSIAAIDLNGARVAVGSEMDAQGLRYGVVKQKGGYRSDARMQYGSDVEQDLQGRLRLVRKGKALSAYYWRNDQWNYFCKIDYKKQKQAGGAGPLFLRVEATNSLGKNVYPALNLKLSPDMETLPSAKRFRETGEILQAHGDYVQAVEKYRQSVSLKPDPRLSDRVKKLENYIESMQFWQNNIALPGRDQDMASILPLNRRLRAQFFKDEREHWYRVRMPSPGSLQVDTEGDRTLFFTLSLLDKQKTLTGDYGGQKSQRSVERVDLDGQEFLIRVKKTRGDGPYFIHARHEPVSYSVDQEPNSSAQEAQEIAVDQKSQGVLGYIAAGNRDTADWFHVAADQFGALKIDLNAEDTLQVRLDLYDASRRHLGGDFKGRESERRLEQADVAPGEYYVRVKRLAGQGGYTLTPTLARASLAEDQEPNDSAEQAQEIEINKATTGLLGYRSDGSRDTTDWCQVKSSHYGSFSTDLNAEDTLQVRLDLYDASRRHLGGDFKGRESERSLEKANVAPGKYYIRVLYQSGHGGYTLNTLLTPQE